MKKKNKRVLKFFVKSLVIGPAQSCVAFVNSSVTYKKGRFNT